MPTTITILTFYRFFKFLFWVIAVTSQANWDMMTLLLGHSKEFWFYSTYDGELLKNFSSWVIGSDIYFWWSHCWCKMVGAECMVRDETRVEARGPIRRLGPEYRWEMIVVLVVIDVERCGWIWDGGRTNRTFWCIECSRWERGLCGICLALEGLGEWGGYSWDGEFWGSDSL